MILTSALPRRSLVLFLLFAGATSGPAIAQWNGTGPVWTTDTVGVGLSNPTYRMHVKESVSSPTMFVESDHIFGTAVWGRTGGTGIGVYGVADATSGNTNGVRGTVLSGTGKGVWGWAQANSGVNYGVYGQTASNSGYSGYFTGGNFYVNAGSGFAGINRTSPINSTERFGINANTSSWGGMYVNTLAGGRPYYGYATAGGAYAYHYYDSASQQWRLYNGGTRIAVNRSNGRVGIKTTSPSYDLHVNGSAGKPGGGSWSNSSDLRLKKDVEDLDGALDKLLSLRGVTFEYLDPESIHELAGERLGVIAQEVEAVFPDWVDEHDDGYKRVTFRGFEAVVIEAVREVVDENTRLAETVDSQARELDDLRARLVAIEAALETR